jgi:hypothetical protein
MEFDSETFDASDYVLSSPVKKIEFASLNITFEKSDILARKFTDQAGKRSRSNFK